MSGREPEPRVDPRRAAVWAALVVCSWLFVIGAVWLVWTVAAQLLGVLTP